jgi:hypothetical protein
MLKNITNKDKGLAKVTNLFKKGPKEERYRHATN